jgi:hypothetical protein
MSKKTKINKKKKKIKLAPPKRYPSYNGPLLKVQHGGSIGGDIPSISIPDVSKSQNLSKCRNCGRPPVPGEDFCLSHL